MKKDLLNNFSEKKSDTSMTSLEAENMYASLADEAQDPDDNIITEEEIDEIFDKMKKSWQENAELKRLISAPIMHISPAYTHSDSNNTSNFIVEAGNAEKQLRKLIHSKGILHTDVQELYHKARSSYEKIILNDHELAELQDIEYSLWILHYKHIEEYRNRIPGSSVILERINTRTVPNYGTVQQKCDNYLEGFKSFLSEAMEFYHCLIKKIRKSYGLPEELLVRECSFSSTMDSTNMHRCLFLCHRCLVCLGDLARYREIYGNPDGQTRSWSTAATHYLKASTIWPNSGNPHNQLAVLARYVDDQLLALYHCIRSLAVKEPFPGAWENLILLFEKNRSSHLYYLSDAAPFDFSKPFERSTLQFKARSSDSFFGDQLSESSGDVLKEQTDLWSLIVRMMSYFYLRPSLEDYPFIFNSTVRELEALLLLDDARLKSVLESYQHLDVERRGPFRVIQLVSVLIFTIHVTSESSKLQNEEHIKYMQQPSLIQQAFITAFVFMGRLVNRCMMTDPLDSSPLLPAILVFTEWLVDVLDRAETYSTKEKCARAISYFFTGFVDLLNQFDGEGGKIRSLDSTLLWEDNELQGFSPISQLYGSSDFKIRQEATFGFDNRKECQVRINRIFVAAMKIVNSSIGSKKWIIYEKADKMFYTIESRKQLHTRESVADDSDIDLNLRGLQKTLIINEDAVALHEATKSCEGLASEVVGKELDEHISSPVEEEEVILFKPIRRQSSAPLYLPVAKSCQSRSEGVRDLAAPTGECLNHGSSLRLPPHEICIDPINHCGGSSMPFWQEPIPEDSVIDSFAESTGSPRFRALNAKRDEPPALAGPPSLSAWVVNKDGLGRGEGKGGKCANKHGPGQIENSTSAYLTDLSIVGTGVSDQDVEITSAPAARFINGYAYHGNSFIDPWDASATTNLMAPPYMPPMPSAPLLPDNASWFNGNSSNYVEQKNLDNGKGFFPFSTEVNNSSNFIETQGPPSCYLNTPQHSIGYTPYAGQTNSAGWLHQYQVNLDRGPDSFPSSRHYTPTFGLYQHHDAPMAAPCVSNVPDEWKRSALFRDARDLRSEQQLLLKYLKEKEWHLQQEAQLRGSA
ncbi:Smg7l [Thalictrum thalictroides]|uniref:Smg7l n=1 Tax=Thalictrum thalictroides TaxID=46969 RepID=A0A7J6V2H3_THATH|nr:Smg7l [Thalictrum thalictroides]